MSSALGQTRSAHTATALAALPLSRSLPTRTTTLTTHALEAPLVDRREVADGTFAFRFLVNGYPPPFLPGQACDLSLPDGQTHRFAIASSPTNGRTLMFAARMRDTPFKDTLRGLPFGAAVQIGPATGTFTLPDDPATPVVFVAGGIGITPFRSMLKWMVDTGDRRPVTLLYSNPTPESMAFLDELEAWRAPLDLTLVPTVTKPAAAGPWPYERGRIDAAFVKRHTPPQVLAKAVVYVSGPPAMVHDLANAMRTLGVHPDRLRVDEFRGY